MLSNEVPHLCDLLLSLPMLGFLNLEVLEDDVVIGLVGFLGDAELEICLLLCFGHLKLYAAGLVEQFSVLIFNFF